jgi:hypothetical protein
MYSLENKTLKARMKEIQIEQLKQKETEKKIPKK